MLTDLIVLYDDACYLCDMAYLPERHFSNDMLFRRVLTSCEMFGLVEMCGSIPKSDKHGIKNAIKNRR